MYFHGKNILPIGFQQRGPLLCESLVEFENLEALRQGLGVGNETGSRERAMSMSRADGKRQVSVAVDLMRWNNLDVSGKPQHHPITGANFGRCR